MKARFLLSSSERAVSVVEASLLKGGAPAPRKFITAPRGEGELSVHVNISLLLFSCRRGMWGCALGWPWLGFESSLLKKGEKKCQSLIQEYLYCSAVSSGWFCCAVLGSSAISQGLPSPHSPQIAVIDAIRMLSLLGVKPFWRPPGPLKQD